VLATESVPVKPRGSPCLLTSSKAEALCYLV
jgi:hypothetical protein